MPINWFPGHMHKTMETLKDQMKTYDLIINVLDARATECSNNQDLLKIFNKPILNVAMKADLSDVKKKSDILFININNKNKRKEIIKSIYKKLDEKIKKYQNKGLVKYKLNVIVVGIPNVGKSSLINYLINKKRLDARNYPGVTNKISLWKIDDSLFINDTPGVLTKKIDNDQIGYILGLIGCIKKELLPLDEVVKFGYEYLIKNYPDLIQKLFKSNKLSFNDFLIALCQKNKYFLPDNKYDFDRAINFLYHLIQTGKIGKISFDINNI